MSAPRVAVVGAGLAGLAAGMALRDGGAHVEVFERTRLLGGKATSFTVDGVEVDNGQHVTLGCCTEFLAFVEALGMRDALRIQRHFRVTMLQRGRRPATLAAAALPAPLHLAPSFIGFPLLSLRDKLRVAAALRAAARDKSAAGDMASWLSRTGQSSTARRVFWEPFLVPALNAPLEECAASDGVFVIRTAFLAHRNAARIGWTTVPLARLAEAAAGRLDAVHLRRGITAIEHDGERVTALQTDTGTAGGFDAVVLAIPPHRLAPLLRGVDDDVANQAAAFTTQPIVDVHLWYEADAPLLGASGFAALIDSEVQWVFEKAPGYLCCSISAAARSVQLNETSLAERCHAELAAVLPALRRRAPLRHAVTRDADATFVPVPGLRRPGPRTALRNLVLAGAWTDTGWPATMESAVRSGRVAAERLLRALQHSTAQRPVELAHAV